MGFWYLQSRSDFFFFELVLPYCESNLGYTISSSPRPCHPKRETLIPRGVASVSGKSRPGEPGEEVMPEET